MDVDAQEVINDLANKIGTLEAKNSILAAQIKAYQKQEKESEE
ncbi:hypothetical protein LFYK43_11120 [Ligilactobacillus salitolerans]|uniref:Uncharacterized protein n=1 Tax=Ligilactobacillus salitolerans TaxID=1808352 RepID=A0A401ISX8_9LACO|nr:hypothetical protein [Ligilactobacillus salitolerans]GBG94653.1 hypothetical protein LFYK43_11120 [Ligilactobacillus salitolerans]